MHRGYISVSRQQQAKGVAGVLGTVSDDKQNELRCVISCHPVLSISATGLWFLLTHYFCGNVGKRIGGTWSKGICGITLSINKSFWRNL